MIYAYKTQDIASCKTLVFLKEIFEKVNFEKNQQATTKARKITQQWQYAKSKFQTHVFVIVLKRNISNVGVTQKNHLSEMVLLNSQNILTET